MDTQQLEHNPTLEECMKLLKGERDEQRLAGLLLVTKFCKSDDHSSLRRVYDAVGHRFLDRLLKTGLGKGAISSSSSGENRDAFLQLSVTVLAAFCRIPEIASSEEMVSKIPLILEIMSKELGSSVLEECYEFLYLVSAASGSGASTLYESGGIKILATQLSSLQDGSHLMDISIKLLQMILTGVSIDVICKNHSSELCIIVATIARQFAVLHSALKFEALHLLTAVLSSSHLEPFFDILRAYSNDGWSNYVRIGVEAVLQNRVAPNERLQALILAESMIRIFGEDWLINQNINDTQNPSTADMCLLLVLEQSRVEVAVLLNELAYLKYEAPKGTSSTSEKFLLKQRNLALAYSLVEKIIKLISTIHADEGSSIDENTLTKVIHQLNDTVSGVLEYLKDAKEHRQKKGDDLLASVRIIGSYLAQAPLACKEQVRELLGYMLSVEGEDEKSPFYAVIFLLPMLCQISMKSDGCKTMVSSGGHKLVVDCFVKLIEPNCVVKDNACVFLACDIIMNLLLKKEEVHIVFDDSTIVNLLRTLAHWTENTNDMSHMMMVASICSLIFDCTSEEALLNHPNFDHGILHTLSQLFAKSLSSFGEDIPGCSKKDTDLAEIVISGYSRWVHRYPHLREAVGT